jgi:hypothetical protein
LQGRSSPLKICRSMAWPNGRGAAMDAAGKLGDAAVNTPGG